MQRIQRCARPLELPDKYDTIIGEKGIKLSGGQRQRVAIARAVLRNSPILVLDEALSAVDAENEAIIQEALDKLMKERTTLILAHRLSSVIDCDRILVLSEGKIAESGKHVELLKNGGIYAELMTDQANENSKFKGVKLGFADRHCENSKFNSLKTRFIDRHCENSKFK